MAVISYIGGTVAICVGTPATIDASGFASVGSYITAGQIVEWGDTGDVSEDITVTTLAGRTLHTNGAKDGGSIAFTLQYELTDAGQVIMRAQNNGNNDVCIKITDPDGKTEYSAGRLANLRQMKRAAGQYKGMTGVFRVNTAVVTLSLIHISEPTRRSYISYAVFCLKKKAKASMI